MLAGWGLHERRFSPITRDMTVDDLRGEVERLVLERQQLRLHDATATELEQNRLRLVAAQQQLSHALIETYAA